MLEPLLFLLYNYQWLELNI